MRLTANVLLRFADDRASHCETRARTGLRQGLLSLCLSLAVAKKAVEHPASTACSPESLH